MRFYRELLGRREKDAKRQEQARHCCLLQKGRILDATGVLEPCVFPNFGGRGGVPLAARQILLEGSSKTSYVPWQLKP